MSTKKILSVSAIVLIAAVAASMASPPERGYLGVSIATVANTDEGKQSNGLYIAGVHEGSGAEAAGLETQDRIAAIDGRPVRTLDDLEAAMASTRPGDEVAVTVLRGQKEGTYRVVLGPPAKERDVSFGGGKYVLELAESRPRLGAELQTLNPQLAEFFDVAGGVLVTRVAEEGPAARAGLRAGDIITEVGEATIRDAGDVNDALLGLGIGDSADLTIRSRGRVEVLPVTFEEVAAAPVPLSFDVRVGTGSKSMTLESDEMTFSGNVAIELTPVDEEESLEAQIHELERQLETLRRRLKDKQAAGD